MSNNSEEIRVVLVDDHEVVRGGLRTCFAATKHIRVVGEAADGEEGLRLIQELRPNLALVDLTMPKLDGIGLIQRLMELKLGVCALVLSFHEAPERMRIARRAGASGYLVKCAPAEQIISAVGRVMSGETCFPANLGEGGVELSRREREVAILIAKGMRTLEIAELLRISERTVESHRHNIRAKLGVETTAEVVQEVNGRGWLEIDIRWS